MKDTKPSVKEFTQVCREHFVPGSYLSIATLEAKLPSDLVSRFKTYPGGIGNLLGLWARQDKDLSKTDRQDYSKAGRPVSVYLYSGALGKADAPTPPKAEVFSPTKLPTVKLLQQAMDLIEEALEQLGVEARAQKKLDELKALLKDA